MAEIINELKEVFELATGAVTLTKEILKLKSNKKDADKANLIKVSKDNSAQIGSSGYSAQIDGEGNNAVISAIGFKSIAKSKIGSWITLAEYNLAKRKKKYTVAEIITATQGQYGNETFKEFFNG